MQPSSPGLPDFRGIRTKTVRLSPRNTTAKSESFSLHYTRTIELRQISFDGFGDYVRKSFVPSACRELQQPCSVLVVDLNRGPHYTNHISSCMCMLSLTSVMGLTIVKGIEIEVSR
jgi:hypothetical protein